MTQQTIHQPKSAHIPEEMLHEYLDAELAPAARQEVQMHLADCARCRAQLDELRNLFVEIETLPDLALETDLTNAILEAIAPDTLEAGQATSTRETRDGLWWLTLLGQLLIALSAGFLAWPWVRQRTDALLNSALLHGWAISREWPQIGPQQGIEWFSFRPSIQELLAALQQAQGWAKTLSEPLLPSYPLLWWAILVAVATLVWLAGNSFLLTTLDQRAALQE